MPRNPRDERPGLINATVRTPAYHLELLADIAAQEGISRGNVIRHAIGSYILSYAAEQPEFETRITEVTTRRLTELADYDEDIVLAGLSRQVPGNHEQKPAASSFKPTPEQLRDTAKKLNSHHEQEASQERLNSLHETATRLINAHSPRHLGKTDPVTGEELLRHDGQQYDSDQPTRNIYRQTPWVFHGSAEFEGQTYDVGYCLKQVGDTWTGHTKQGKKFEFSEGKANSHLWEQEPITLTMLLRHPATGYSSEFPVAAFRDDKDECQVIEGYSWNETALDPRKEADAEKLNTIEQTLTLFEQL